MAFGSGFGLDVLLPALRIHNQLRLITAVLRHINMMHHLSLGYIWRWLEAGRDFLLIFIVNNAYFLVVYLFLHVITIAPFNLAEGDGLVLVDDVFDFGFVVEEGESLGVGHVFGLGVGEVAGAAGLLRLQRHLPHLQLIHISNFLFKWKYLVGFVAAFGGLGSAVLL